MPADVLYLPCASKQLTSRIFNLICYARDVSGAEAVVALRGTQAQGLWQDCISFGKHFLMATRGAPIDARGAHAARSVVYIFSLPAHLSLAIWTGLCGVMDIDVAAGAALPNQT